MINFNILSLHLLRPVCGMSKRGCHSYIELLSQAVALENLGKISNAEEMYKQIIQKYPTYEEPYQRLWDSWLRYSSLKVSKKEMDDFAENYSKYIQNINEPPHSRIT